MRLSRYALALFALLVTSPGQESVQAAVGVPENIVLYRDFDPNLGIVQIFVQKRVDANSFAFPGPGQEPFFLDTSGGAPGDAINVADVNGDGTDDLMVVQDATMFGFDQLTIAGFTIPGDPPTLQGPGTNNAQRPDGNGGILDETAITRRDFDNDGLADTAIVLDGNINFSSDTLLWSFRGSFDGTQSLPLNGAGLFYSPAAGFGGVDGFGQPIGMESIPLVGDFNGDGIADRAVSNNAGLVSGGSINGRQVQIDLSPGVGNIGDLGDGIPDNISEVFGSLDTDDIRAADINGDGLDDIVAIRPADLDDGMGGTIETFALEGYINTGIFDSVNPTFTRDTAFDSFAGARNLNDTIHFGTFGFLDIADIDADFNDDSNVDGTDFLTWQSGFGLTGQTDKSTGDSNGDGNVDGTDLDNWGTQYGTTSVTPSLESVPEPASGFLCLFAALGLVSRGRFERQ